LAGPWRSTVEAPRFSCYARPAPTGSADEPIPQVALTWLLARSPAILPIPAATNITHLRETLDAQDLEPIPEEL
jgi:aryl-alcohol dehydrogenase-like predicted oxidoreductase